MNRQYQEAFRERHTTAEEAEFRQRKNWRLEHAKRQFEMMHAEGMSATAIAEKLGYSHHTVLDYLARPEARERVWLLRRHQPEPEMIH